MTKINFRMKGYSIVICERIGSKSKRSVKRIKNNVFLFMIKY